MPRKPATGQAPAITKTPIIPEITAETAPIRIMKHFGLMLRCGQAVTEKTTGSLKTFPSSPAGRGAMGGYTSLKVEAFIGQSGVPNQ